MRYVHLYDADNNWVGQFRSVDAVEAYIEANELDINNFRLEFGPSRYPA